MRITIAYYFLILYTVAIGKPALPLIQDVIAHMFWHAEHISTVHHHHGDHHTDKQIAGTSHDEAHKKGSQALKISESVSAHLVVVNNYIGHYPIKKQQYALLICDAFSTTLKNNDPPPKGC